MGPWLPDHVQGEVQAVFLPRPVSPASPWVPGVERRPVPRFRLAVVDAGKCTACGLCEQVCASRAIRIEDRAIVDEGLCIGCAECIAECPEEAIVLSDPVFREVASPAPDPTSETP